MLDQKDFDAIRLIMKEEIAESERRMEAKLAESENLLLEEMDRLQTNLTNRMDKIDSRLDTMQHEVNACKLEAGTLDILLRRIDRLESQLEELRARIA